MAAHLAHRLRGGIAWTARWRPAILGPVDVILSVYAMAVMAIVRGYDYGTGREADSGSAVLSGVEAAMPLPMWSAAFTVAGLLLGLGAWRKWHGVVWLGHAILATLYAALAVGISAVVVTAGWPWMDGIRGATVLILPTCMHWILALRTGPRPLRGGEPVATVITGDAAIQEV